MTTLTPNKSLTAQIYQKLTSGAECGIEVVAAPGAKPSLALAHKVALTDASTLAGMLSGVNFGWSALID